MKNNKYYITERQLDTINYYKTMFNRYADTIEELCDSEKDDIVYGFELGRISIQLRDGYINMMELAEEIQKQQ